MLVRDGPDAPFAGWCVIGYAAWAMTAAAPTRRYAYAEYLALEEKSLTKHEYLDGQIIDMSSAAPEHARLAMRIGVAIGRAMHGGPCEMFSSDLRIRVEATGLATYPDLSIICDHIIPHPEDRHAATNPTVLVEVLSDSTEAYDRGAKFAHYQRIPSLREYVLVSQHEPRIEVFRRHDDGSWGYVATGAGGRVSLASIGIEIAVDDVYRTHLASPAA